MRPTRQECVDAAGEVYAAVLADPLRRAQLREHREVMHGLGALDELRLDPPVTAKQKSA